MEVKVLESEMESSQAVAEEVIGPHIKSDSSMVDDQGVARAVLQRSRLGLGAFTREHELSVELDYIRRVAAAALQGKLRVDGRLTNTKVDETPAEMLMRVVKDGEHHMVRGGRGAPPDLRRLGHEADIEAQTLWCPSEGHSVWAAPDVPDSMQG